MCMQITWDACRFWASRLGNGDWDSAHVIMLITPEKSVFMRAVPVGSSAFCSLILCYFLTLWLSHMDLWLLHDHTTPWPLHCLSMQPKTLFFHCSIHGWVWDQIQLPTTYLYLNDTFLKSGDSDYCSENGVLRTDPLRWKPLIEKPEDGNKPCGYLGRTFWAERKATAKGFCVVCGEARQRKRKTGRKVQEPESDNSRRGEKSAAG